MVCHNIIQYSQPHFTHIYESIRTPTPHSPPHITPPTQVQAHLKQLPSLVHVPIPSTGHFTVCGDVHGQYYDLLNVFELNGMPSVDNPYLFNGGCVF